MIVENNNIYISDINIYISDINISISDINISIIYTTLITHGSEIRRGRKSVRSFFFIEKTNEQQTSTRAQEAVCAIVALSQNHKITMVGCVISVINKLAMSN